MSAAVDARPLLAALIPPLGRNETFCDKLEVSLFPSAYIEP
jgi:hypothetical protein